MASSKGIAGSSGEKKLYATEKVTGTSSSILNEWDSAHVKNGHDSTLTRKRVGREKKIAKESLPTTSLCTQHPAVAETPRFIGDEEDPTRQEGLAADVSFSRKSMDVASRFAAKLRLKSRQAKENRAAAAAAAQTQTSMQNEALGQEHSPLTAAPESIMADVYSVAFAEGVMMFQPSKGAKASCSDGTATKKGTKSAASFATVVEAAYRKSKQTQDPEDVNSRISSATRWKLLDLATKAKQKASMKQESNELATDRCKRLTCTCAESDGNEDPDVVEKKPTTLRQTTVRFMPDTVPVRRTNSNDNRSTDEAVIEYDGPSANICGADKECERNSRHRHTHRAHHHRGRDSPNSHNRHRHRKEGAQSSRAKGLERQFTNKQTKCVDRKEKRPASNDAQKRVGRILDEDADRVKLAIKTAHEALEASGQSVPETPNDWNSEDEAEFEREERERLLQRQKKQTAKQGQQSHQMTHSGTAYREEAGCKAQHKCCQGAPHRSHNQQGRRLSRSEELLNTACIADEEVSQQISEEVSFGVSAWGTLPAAGVW